MWSSVDSDLQWRPSPPPSVNTLKVCAVELSCSMILRGPTSHLASCTVSGWEGSEEGRPTNGSRCSHCAAGKKVDGGKRAAMQPRGLKTAAASLATVIVTVG
ncbi:hypothetical protein AAFF_G00042070 [Aldrovandia affinis]|uniref:Uncharacterized protein n=1 Tax=Aldrovandia affinis TaxID=143900 RepID=A0AAD7S331_9TELE|nr:hypothetical protein AAFF_G00042070 [Aldrovandia affinis]